MNWNAKPENAAKAPPYSKSQSILQQFLMTSTASQSAFSYPAINQETCMYPTNSNSASQPPLNGRSYMSPQNSVSNVHNRTVAASQSSVQRVTCANVKGPQQQNHNLQTVSSGVMPNGWLSPSVRSFMPSHTEAGISHSPGGGTNMPYMHEPQAQLVPSDTYSVQLQMTPSNSLKVPVTYQGNYQGNQGLNHSVSQPDQMVAWTQYTSSELTYPEYRPPPVQYSYLPQSFVPSTASLQVKNNQLPTYTQALQPKRPVPVSSYQCAAETNKALSTLPHSCRYGSPHMQNSQPVNKQLPLEVPQSTEMHSPEKKRDPYRGFKQQWQNTNEKVGTIGKFCELKINTKQSYSESVGSSGDGIQTLQNNQEKRKYSYNPNTNQAIDTNVTKEKLVRDIKSLVEIKKKFSELARKIKINKDLLMAAGCSKTANTSYTEPTQPSEFSTREMSAKGDNHCSMELLATCLSLWKNQPPKTTGENIPKPLEEKQCNTSRTNTIAVGNSSSTSEVKTFCLGVGNSQKTMSSSQTMLSVLTPSYDAPGVAVGKGTELQIAVVSPLVLSDTSALPGKELAAHVLPETTYPVVKEGSVCSLQNQQAETFDVTGVLASSTIPAEVSLPIREHKPQGDPDIADSSLGKLSPLGTEALLNLRDSTVMSAPMLQIESICSLAEGDVSYNSQIAEIFNCVQNEAQKPSPNQVINSQQEQVGDTSENKDLSFQKDRCVQFTEGPLEVTEQPEQLQPLEPASCENVEANREIPEESRKEHPGGKESPAKDVCSSSAAVQQDPLPQETDISNNSVPSLLAVSDVNDESEPVSYLHDQLSELLREFPYGIETVTKQKDSVAQQKTHEILENQTGIKTGKVSGVSTDQIKVTVLDPEQIKELFPEEDQACDLDRLEEPENKKAVAEVKSPCDSQDPGVLDLEKDKIHCCALGWLSMVYEGVPQCRCSSTEGKRKDQCSSDLNSCKQKEQSCDSGITVFEINPVSNSPNTPLAEVPEKGSFSETHGVKIKTSKTEDSSSPRVEQELTCDFLVKCYKKDKTGNVKTEHVNSLKMEQKLTNVSPKCDTPNSSKSNKMATPKIFHVVTSNSDKNTPSSSKQASQESQQKKNISQDSGSLKAHVRPLPNRDPYRRNSSLVQSMSPEKKKLKFKAGGSRLKYFEKRKRDHVISPDVDIKKKKYERQEQNKNAGDTLKLCNTLTEDPNERASVKEKMVPSSESLDSRGSSSKSTRVITVQEYLQRQKDKHVSGNVSKNTCVENVPCDSEPMKSSKHSAPASWVKLVEGQSISTETSKELEHNSTIHGKNLKIHHAEKSRAQGVPSNNSQGKFGGKQLDKTYIDKNKFERLTSSESSQTKEQKKQYLNRVAFKCTERESICLTKLDSAFKKLSKEKKSTAYAPRTKDIDKPSMLEFKLCPDVLLKNPSSVDKQDAPKPGPGKEQVPLQVSGIKSTKEDWLKCIPTRTKVLESSQETDRPDSRLCKRSFSANEFETLQNPVKDSDVMFRTYKKMYLEKRSRSLGSSPVK